VGGALVETLSFLSDDDYEFGFTRHPDPPPLRRYLFQDCSDYSGREIQEVLLFSGGLDSLCGAVQEVLQGQRPVALVSHRPAPQTYHRQRQLVDALASRLPGPGLRPLHVAVEINKGKPLGRDFMQRTRSFLYGAVAAVVALSLNLERVRFYENGVTSLNLPLSPQVLGGRASRTTHPKAIKGFERLFSNLFACNFRIQNPFLWKTKAEILAELRTSGHGALAALSGSCSHIWTRTISHPHCGRCSQCVDRRLSALAAEFGDAEDPRSGYESDVLTGPREAEELTLIERYLGLARRVDAMQSQVELLSEFGEVSRLLKYVDLPSVQAMEQIFMLHKRHAEQVCGAVARALRAESEELVRQRYPHNCLLRISLGGTPTQSLVRPSDSDEPPPNPSAPHLILDETTFAAHFGTSTCFLGNGLEFALLARLNQRPGDFVSVETLIDDVWDDDQTAKNTVQRTVSNLRRRLREAGITQVTIDGCQRNHYRLVISA
jgi:hypothetical protein